ncbi:hypothetical protein H2203_006067 [Taxawa tesnikishii (nom. ined.)]|nr:hypothetical protein H2203_006067 [Dothideales sp. JES 119]
MREAHSLAKKNQITHKEEDDNIIPSPDFDHPAQQDKLHYLHLRSPVQIPQKLLSEPWTQPKIAFLRYLTFVGAGIDWEHSTAGETATQGLRSAIASRNRFVVACLVSAPVGVSPSASLFRFAVIDNGCDQTVVFHLLAAALRSQVMVRFQPASTGHSATDFNFRDPSIWSWAGRAKAGGNAKGSWLTRALKYAAGAASTATTYDRAAHEDFVRACGRVEDGVEQIEVPLGVVEGEPQT